MLRRLSLALLVLAAALLPGAAAAHEKQTLRLRFPRVDKASLEEFKTVRKALESEGQPKDKGKSKARSPRKS